MNVLITGARGWLGNALAEVVSQEHNVCAFDLKDSEFPFEEISFDGETVFGSVADFDSIRKAIEGQDAVIHAAVANTRNTSLYQHGNPVPFQVNVQGTYNVLEAALQEGIRHIILIASAETHVQHPEGMFLDHKARYFGLPGNVYDLTKHLQEEAAMWFAHQHGMNITSLRLGDIVDLNRGITKWDAVDGDFWRKCMETGSWIDRYDVGRACLKAFELELTGFQVFHLVGAPQARERFDIERTKQILGMQFTTDFDSRPARERD